MASGIFYPAVSGDDGCIQTGHFYSGAGSGLTFGNAANQDTNSFIRFANIAIPQGTIITEAKLVLNARSSSSANTCNVRISANDVDDAVAPINTSEFNALVLTTATVDWDAVGTWTIDSDYDSPEIKTIIQEITDRDGWANGNALTILIKNNASTSGVYRVAHAIDDNAGADVAELHVTWAFDTEITLPTPFSSETSLQSNIQVELVPGILSAEASMSIGELFYGIFVECPSPFTAEGLLQANTEIDITATSFIAQTNLQSNIQVELIPNVLSAETSLSIGELFCGVMLECPSPFTAVGSLQANIGHSITIVPFIAQTNLQSNIQVEIVPPSFVATSSLDSIVTLLHRSSLSLINGIRFGSDLSLINSLNLDINSQLALVNDILTGLTGDLILKMDINELAKLNDALTLINNINDENSGVSQGPFYFLKSHGL